MGRHHMFIFTNVLPVDDVDNFYTHLKVLFENSNILGRLSPKRGCNAVQYMDCMVEDLSGEVKLEEMTDRGCPKLRNIKGTIQFVLKHKLKDVKQFFMFGYGKRLCRHLFIVQVPNVYEYREFVDTAGCARRFEWGKLKAKVKKLKS